MSLTSNFESQLSFPFTNAHTDTFLNFELSEPTTRMFDTSKKMDFSTAQNTFGKKNKSTTVIGDKSNKKFSNKVIKKPYQCPHCFKCFPKPSALTPHIYTHTGEKPFQCHMYVYISIYFHVSISQVYMIFLILEKKLIDNLFIS